MRWLWWSGGAGGAGGGAVAAVVLVLLLLVPLVLVVVLVLETGTKATIPDSSPNRRRSDVGMGIKLAIRRFLKSEITPSYVLRNSSTHSCGHVLPSRPKSSNFQPEGQKALGPGALVPLSPWPAPGGRTWSITSCTRETSNLAPLTFS